MTGRLGAIHGCGAATASTESFPTCAPGVDALIPTFIDGVLPEGIYRCSMEEVVQRFGAFQESDRRPRLTEALKLYITEVRNLGVAQAVIIDGSYVTMKARPNDIDLILVLRKDALMDRELKPAEYNGRSTAI